MERSAPRRRRHKVHFIEEHNIIDYPNEEIDPNNSWYTVSDDNVHSEGTERSIWKLLISHLSRILCLPKNSERKGFEREIKRTIKAYKSCRSKSVPFEDNENVTIRGLEERLSHGALLCARSQKNHYRYGVIREQTRRRNEGQKDQHFYLEPYLISSSKWAAENAREKGVSYANDCMEALDEPLPHDTYSSAIDTEEPVVVERPNQEDQHLEQQRISSPKSWRPGEASSHATNPLRQE